MMNLHWWDFVGFAGVFLVLGAYFLLQTGKMRGDRVPYSLVNQSIDLTAPVCRCKASSATSSGSN